MTLGELKEILNKTDLPDYSEILITYWDYELQNTVSQDKFNITPNPLDNEIFIET